MLFNLKALLSSHTSTERLPSSQGKMTTMWEKETTLDKDIYGAALVFSQLHHLFSEELLEVLWLFSLQ